MKATMTWAMLALSGTLMLMEPAAAAPLRSGMGGPEGYGELTQNPNDDGSSNELRLPFNVKFFSEQFYDTFYVNNNGNISFTAPQGSYTPSPFPASSLPVIAPYWADVDTRSQPGGGAVYVASPNQNTVVVTWHNVGYYSGHNDKLNDFQMTLLNRSETGAGNFDIEFRYNKLEWTTGDASQGVGGLGGTPAQAGYDAGNGTNFFVLPGSFSSDILNLVNTSNVSSDTPGVWTMAIRNGQTADGATPEAPLLPTIVTDGSYQFDFEIELGQQIFIDPLVAIGYDYEVQSGPNIRSVLLPTVPGDTDGYDIYVGGSLLASIMAGQEYFFTGDGVSAFSVRGIDIDAMLDPANTQAFVTGLTFVGDGRVQMTQTPVTIDTDPADVPEPSALALMLLGGLAAARARRSARGGRQHG